MRKLKLLVQMSIDGFVADPDGKTDWMIWNWGPIWTWDSELIERFNDLKSTIDCILLSRKMAEEGFINHWAKVADDDESPQSIFAKKIHNAHKVVFTKTLDKSIWSNTSLAGGDLTTEVTKLKNQPGKDMIVYGGASFVSSLIKARLIDEFYFYINPTILGNGMTIFKDIQDFQTFRLLSSTSYNCGMSVQHYSTNLNT
jgi:dihydrofolate reductase